MNTEQILMCVVALIIGMLLANMLKSVCGCKVVEGQYVLAKQGTADRNIEDMIEQCLNANKCDNNCKEDPDHCHQCHLTCTNQAFNQYKNLTKEQ